MSQAGGFWNWKIILIGAQMLFVAFGAMVLMPLLTGLDPSVALFTAGLGTLLFQWITRRSIPVFLASSFVFVAPISHGVQQWGVPATMGALFCTAVVYVILGALVKWRGPGFLHRLMPPVVTGPIIMVIGLSLAPTAVNFAIGVRTITPRIGEVMEGMPAASAGLKPGDVFVSIDGWDIGGFEDVQRIVSINGGRELTIGVDRDGQRLDFKITPKIEDQKDPFGGTFRRGLIGVKPAGGAEALITKQVGALEALRLGVRETYTNIAQTLQGIGDIIARRQAADQMGGPILMAEVTAKVAELGIAPMLLWIAFISANIGFLNLLPIPVLDGGHLMFYAIEAVRRKPLSQRMQEIGFQIGIALVLMLMVYVNLNDLLRVWRRLMGDG